MSKIKSLGAAVSLTSAVAQTGVLMDGTPFAPGFNANVVISLTGATGTPTVKIQGSVDNSVWTDLVTVAAITANLIFAEVTLSKYMRLFPTVVGTAGTVTAVLIE